ncbi:VWA domain-containing protein, partial [Candidatus Micrarchaeota archaeon]|nr:VWA domain-containing protein [Candidatus Micrarchaeota archaeon]MBU1940071.1 VWA domain-containing protein [Candidatus Micrarchaeota archaeon]
MNSANRAGKGAHTQRGFTISLDAVFALLIVITFIGFGRVVLFETQGTDTLAKLQAIQRADDVFTTMINTGSIWESLDEPGLTTGSIEDIYDKMDAQLPENIDFMITMRLYDSTIDADCRTSKDFKNCLSGVPFERSKGGNKPIQGDILHGRRVFVKKQPEPDCTYCGNGVCDDDEGENCSTCSGDCLPTGLECCLGIVCAFGETCVDDVCTPPGGFAPATFPFLGSSKIAHLEGEGMNLLLRTELAPEYSPADELDCDETENVHLEIEASAGEGRAPADIMMLLDRGEFMGRFLVKDSLINISHYCRDTWEVAGTFYNADFRSFQIVPDDPAIAFRLTDPSSETHLVNEGTFMKPTDIGIWTVECRKTGGGKTVNFSKYYRNIEAEQHSAVDFLSTASLQEPDQAGLVTFGTDVTLDAQLTTDEDAVITEIWAIPMPPGGGTNIAGAMNMAVDEFNTRGGEGYVRVAILMSDAAAEKGDVDGAIANAVANNVVFYTIAVGEGSDEGALQEIALGTSGEFWKITDTDTLDT